MSPAADGPLRDALGEARRIGAIGPVSIDELIAHSRLYVEGLRGVSGRVIDLGSGGGVPGLVVAWDRPDLEVILVDRRSKRADLLRRAVSAMAIAERTVVLTCDVERIEQRWLPADAVTARLFAEPAVTLAAAARLVRPGGRVLVSDPPDGEAWRGASVDSWRRRSIAVADGSATISCFSVPG